MSDSVKAVLKASDKATTDSLNYEARSALDSFTVLQDIPDVSLKAKAYEVDDTVGFIEEALAANPLLGIKNQNPLQGMTPEDLSTISERIEASEFDAATLQDLVASIQNGRPSYAGQAEGSSSQVENRNSTDAEQSLQSGGRENNPVETSSVGEGSLGIETTTGDTAAENFIENPTALNAVLPGGVPEGDTLTLDDSPGDDVEPALEDDGLDSEGGETSSPIDAPETDENETNDESLAIKPLTPELNVRVSNATDNQDTINSENGFDLLPMEYGKPQIVTGEEMNLPGVKAGAQITYIFHDENSVEVTLDTAWNSVKNIEVDSDAFGTVVLNNFVHTDVTLGEGGSTVIINGAKRGNIKTADADDRVEVNAQSNGNGWGNDFNIDTGKGNDVIDVTGDVGVTGFNIDAGDGNDNVTVDGFYEAANVSLGQGDDSFQGGEGNDVVHGGDGHDNIKGGKGVDFIDGGEGDDIIVGGSGADTLYGGEGDDKISGGVNPDEIYGGSGDDTIKGGAGGDDIDGGSGDDVIDGGSGADVVDGGEGNDIIYAGIGDTITGGEGNDLFIIKPGAGNITITDFGGVGGGGRGEADLLPVHDTLKLEGEGLTAENMLLDYAGDNTLISFEGLPDFTITLEDFDFTDLDNLPSVGAWNIIFDGQDNGTDAYDVFNNHLNNQNSLWNSETVTFLNEGDNTVKGTDKSDVVNAMDGSDTIEGQGGDDVLRGQGGDDILYGDDPTDTGSSYVTTEIDVTYISTTAGYKNAIGAYAVDAEGTILSVNIGIENQKAAQEGDKFTIEVSGPEASGVGYFILSNGYNQNQDFFDRYDSSDGEYAFLYKAGTEDERAANIHDNPDDIDLVFNTGGETIVLNGNAYHSNAALNTDGQDHITVADNGDGTTRLGFEDLPNLGDADFTDVVIDVSVDYDTVYTLPEKQGGDDRLVGGLGDDTLIGQGGDDRLEGGAGVDTVVLTGFQSEYEFTFNEDGSITVVDTVQGRDGVDTLDDIEYLTFRDGTVQATPDMLILPDVSEGQDQDEPENNNNDVVIEDGNNQPSDDQEDTLNEGDDVISSPSEETANDALDLNTGEESTATQIELLHVNDWYNPEWGGGYNATFKLTLTEDNIGSDGVDGWSLAVDLNNPDAVFSSGWLDGFNGSASFDAQTGIFTNVDQSYQPVLNVGDTIQFSIQVQNAGFDMNDLSFDFRDADFSENIQTLPEQEADTAYGQNNIDESGGAGLDVEALSLTLDSLSEDKGDWINIVENTNQPLLPEYSAHMDSWLANSEGSDTLNSSDDLNDHNNSAEAVDLSDVISSDLSQSDDTSTIV